MELFQKAATVKLSHRDKYLTAQADQVSVCLERNESSLSSIWTVEFVPGGEILRFKSCYGKYLTASNVPFLPGTSGRRVLQTLPERLDSSIQWEPIGDGFSARFKTPYGYFLRPNGGLPPWRNSVTHEIPYRMGSQEKVLWHVDVVETVPKPRNLKRNRSKVVIPPNARS